MATLQQTLARIEQLAPPALSASWDNTGLLIVGTREVSKIGLAIDLTEPVFDELEAAGVDLLLAYHPPIFKGVKRLTGRSGLERVLLRTIRAGMHLYAPHTALDAAAGGMGDWLLASVGDTVEAAPIEPAPDDPTVGMGRLGTLPTPQTLERLLPAIKRHLGLRRVRVAGDLTRPRQRVAVCPGAGGSLFESVRDVDLFITGEMRHHDVLARVAEGSAVILTDHTNTERGYLPELGRRLMEGLRGVEVVVSKVDADPLSIR